MVVARPAWIRKSAVETMSPIDRDLRDWIPRFRGLRTQYHSSRNYSEAHVIQIRLIALGTVSRRDSALHWLRGNA